MGESERQGDAVERDAVAALRRGDISGLEALVHRYQAPGLRLAIALAGDREVAEDAVSDAFLRVLGYRYDGRAGRRSAGPAAPVPNAPAPGAPAPA